MPEGDLSALRDVLPTWVNLVAWFGLPAIGIAATLFVTWLADRVNRPNYDGIHWTEKARQHYEGTRVVSAQAWIHAVLAGFLTFMLGRGLLVDVDPYRRAIVVTFLAWLVTSWLQMRRARRVVDGLTVAEFFLGQLFWWIIFLPILLVTAAMALFGPAEFGWSFALVYGTGIVLIVWFLRGGATRVGRLLGIIQPADERITRIVADAAARTGHAPANSWLGRTPMANAIAYPVTNELVFTTKAAEKLTDEQLFAITLHEIGHLKESSDNTRRRLRLVFLFVVLGLWRPIYGELGVWAFLGLVALGFVFAVQGVRTVRKLETEADDHAHDHSHEDEEGDYARALERLYEVNLAPAVMRGKNNTHPHLYDRMIAAGVTPDYERPAPPSNQPKQMVAFTLVALAVVFAQIFAWEFVKRHAYDGESHALHAVAWTGGDAWMFGSLGYVWEKHRPEDAVFALTVADAHTDWPEYPARLARILAKTDPDRAREALARAEARLVGRDEVEAWMQELVDTARSRLGLPPRDW